MSTDGGSPVAGGGGGQALDGNALALRILQATEAAAQAATSTATAVQLLKDQASGSSGKSSDWFKLLPKPSTFSPANYDQEVSMWRDWWWSVLQYLCTLDVEYDTELRDIEKDLSVVQDVNLMSDEEKKRSMFLYGLLA